MAVQFDDGAGRVVAGAVLAVVVVLLAVGGLGSAGIGPASGLLDREVPTPEPTPLPVRSSTAEGSEPSDPVVTDQPSTTAAPSETATPSPTPTATATESPRQTALFEGGPARGPWQQLGTVAEITHPGAPMSARYSWTNFWSDPDEENQPDELWDQLVIEVTDQLLELGEPVDRPAFGGAPGSEPFNSFGGVQDLYGEGVATATWHGVVDIDGTIARVFFAYLLDNGEAVDRLEPIFVAEGEVDSAEQAAEIAFERIQIWAQGLGYDSCDRC